MLIISFMYKCGIIATLKVRFFFSDAEDQSFGNKINTEKETCKSISLPMT